MLNFSKKIVDNVESSSIVGIGRFIEGEILGRPRTVSIEVTMRCNARCAFCNYWRLPKMEELADYQPVLKRLRPLSVIVTGGEPLLRRDLPDLVYGIKRSGVPMVSLLTNGRLLTLEKARELKRAGVDTIAVSLNYAGEAQDDERHLPGLFEHIRSIMPDVGRLGFKRVTVNSVFLDDNLDDIMNIIELVSQWGVGITFSCYSAHKARNANYNIKEENIFKLRKLLEQIRSIKKNHSFVESSDWYLGRVLEFYQSGRVRGRCPAGRKMVHVTPDGLIKPCPDLPSLGHYRDFEYRRVSQTDCDSCWYACRGETEAPLDLKRIAYFLALWKGARSQYIRDKYSPVMDSILSKLYGKKASQIARK